MSTPDGPFLNAIGILLGALIGLAQQKPFSLRAQLFCRNIIGAATIVFGVRLLYLSLEGAFLPSLKHSAIAMLALMLGYWAGKLLRLQRMSNYLGRLASHAIAEANRNPGKPSADGFNACAILFCAAPLGIVGAAADGLSGYWYLLAIKGAMDALAMSGFVKIFQWPAALSAFAAFVFLGVISLGAELCETTILTPLEVHSINAVAGLIACIVTVVIFEVRRVELANYLPALVLAPILTKLWG